MTTLSDRLVEELALLEEKHEREQRELIHRLALSRDPISCGPLLKLDNADEEAKAAAFDTLYEMAAKYVGRVAETGRTRESVESEVYEVVMEMTMGSKVWEVINCLVGVGP